MAPVSATAGRRVVSPEHDQPGLVRQPLLRSRECIGRDRTSAALMDAAMTQGCRPDRQPNVAGSAALMSSTVQIACPERAPFLTEQRLAGGQAPDRGAPPGRRGPDFCGGFEAEGKIKGRGTCARPKPCLHVGWRGTRLNTRCAVREAKCPMALVNLRVRYATSRCTALEVVA